MEYLEFITYINWKFKNITDNNKKLNFLREELQKNILFSIYSRKNNLYFMWWTNLRICYNLDRFSEDLNFVLDKPDKKYNIEDTMKWITDDFLNKNWFQLKIKIGNVKTVQKALIKFWWILYDTWLSPLKEENIVIKFKVDTNPSDWSEYSEEIIKTTNWTCLIKNQNLNTTFSWKIGALLLREYVKWRDYYDMYWYLKNYSHKKFNLIYIQKVIEQYNENNKQNKTLKTIKIPKDYKETLNMVLEKWSAPHLVE